MPDIIKLLPDSIANQIAAGEVIQRPASVIKELMENALDAGADQITVIVKDAGKTLLQVVDNGMGMSETDARMSFERHATSKIRSADDLFAIRTMGFRGEALASIASVSQVELKTRQADQQVGTRLVIDGSLVNTQEPCQTAPGTIVSVRNLFFNVPARRKFLKSDPVEFRHIMDEFSRVALAHPEIGFSLHHNDNEVYTLPKSNLRQRLVNFLGKKYNELLVPVSEETTYVGIGGFVGKPEAARKARGDQFVFVNRRFIRSPYLHHAIRGAYEEMIPEDGHPLYMLYLEVDPARIDVNVHPTKQEIKFEDERLIYNYLRVAVRHALGKYSVTPSLDFEQSQAFNPVPGSGSISQTPGVSSSVGMPSRDKENLPHWEKLFEGLAQPVTAGAEAKALIEEGGDQAHKQIAVETLQIHGSFIVTQTKSGMLMIDQKSAHQRILYERYLSQMKDTSGGTQKLLFPETIELSTADAQTLQGILDEVNRMGFDVQEFGGTSFVIHGVPALMDDQNPGEVVQHVISKFIASMEDGLGLRERVAKAMAESSALPSGSLIGHNERVHLIESLFSCENPYTSPAGKRCFVIMSVDELQSRIFKT
jgi:DNA mismatch repair protein MutL